MVTVIGELREYNNASPDLFVFYPDVPGRVYLLSTSEHFIAYPKIRTEGKLMPHVTFVGLDPIVAGPSIGGQPGHSSTGMLMFNELI